MFYVLIREDLMHNYLDPIEVFTDEKEALNIMRSSRVYQNESLYVKEFEYFDGNIIDSKDGECTFR